MPTYLTPATVLGEWPYAPTRAVEQLELFLLGRPNMGAGLLCFSSGLIWAGDWNSFCGVAGELHRRAGEKLGQELVSRFREGGPALRAVARGLTGPGVDRHAPLRPGLIEDWLLGLHGLVSEGARIGVENSRDVRDDTSSGDGAVASPVESAPL